MPILRRHGDPGHKRPRRRAYVDDSTVYFDAPDIGRSQAIEGLGYIGAARADDAVKTEDFTGADCEAHLPEDFSSPESGRLPASVRQA